MPYQLSQNYEQLYALLLQGEEVACFIDRTNIRNEIYRSIASCVITKGGYLHVDNEAVAFVGTNDAAIVEALTAECHGLSLSFIPQHDVGKIAGDAFSAGEKFGINAQRWVFGKDEKIYMPNRSAYIASLQPL